MSTREPSPPTSSFDDEQLIAYLDGVMPASQRTLVDVALTHDTALAQRLDALKVDTALLPQAFAPLLANAPALDLKQLQARAGEASKATDLRATAPAPKDDLSPRRSAGLGAWSMAACLAVSVALGFVAGRWSDAGTNPSASAPSGITDWQLAVVEYQRLYVTQTLAQASVPGEAELEQQLASVSNFGGLKVSGKATQLPGLSFRRAQNLGVQGRPLIQMVYVTERGEPVALCFTREGRRAEAPKASVIAGMNTVTWSNGEFGFVMVGPADSATLMQAAQVAATRL